MFFFLSLSSLISPQLYSSVDFGRKWQLIHEHVTPNRFYWWVILFHVSALFFLFCSTPPLWSFVYSGMQKLLLVFCATEQVILMAWNKVCDWLVVLLKFCTFCTAWYNQAEINLLSQHALHSASEDMSHCTSSLTRALLISGTLHISNSITILHQSQRRGGCFFFFFCTDADAEAYVQYEGLWLIMDPGRPCHFLSVHVWGSLPLQCNYYVWKCTLIRNVGPDLFQLIAPHPLAEVTGVCPGLPLAKSIVTCINLELLPCHCGIILNNVHNPSHWLCPLLPKSVQGHLNTGWASSNG